MGFDYRCCRDETSTQLVVHVGVLGGHFGFRFYVEKCDGQRDTWKVCRLLACQQGVLTALDLVTISTRWRLDQ